MNISINTVPHHMQRYDTVGDYWQGGDCSLQIAVSELPDKRMEYLVAIHELIEAVFSLHNQVPFAKIDKFDKEHPDAEEPGDLPEAPYHPYHKLATEVEKRLAKAFGVDWTEYGKVLERLQR